MNRRIGYPDGETVRIRTATLDDLPDIVRMLADDPLGATREQYRSPLPDAYVAAFSAIDGDPNNELVVLELLGAVKGVLQLTFIPHITHQGGCVSPCSATTSAAGAGATRKRRASTTTT